MTFTVGIVGAGDMGSAVGAALRAHGCRVLTDLTGRSPETRLLAADRGLEDVGSLAAVAASCDLFLAILPPAAAQAFATRFLREVPAPGPGFVYADCNALAPDHVRAIHAQFEAAGGRFVDVGIVGPPPGRGALPTRFYASGPDLAAVLRLDGMGISVHPLGPEIGRASALKMVYAGENKGTIVLQMAMLLAAERLGVLDVLVEEFAQGKPAVWQGMRRSLPGLAAVAGRWHGEMHEIATTLAASDLPAGFHGAAAELLEGLARTPLARETRRTVDPTRDVADTVRLLERALRGAGADDT